MRPTVRGRANDQLVLEILVQAGRPLSAYDVLGALNLRASYFPASVYRALGRLTAAGRIHRLDSRNAYIPCTAAHRPGEANVLAVCRDCGAVREFEATGVRERLIEAGAGQDFAVCSGLIEVEGVCGRCRDGA